MAPQAAEVAQLLNEAKAAYADPERKFTLAAIPRPAENTDCVVSLWPCEEESPDRGQIREGRFYWPHGSFRLIGGANVGVLGTFHFVAFDESTAERGSIAFAEFSRRCAACLAAMTDRTADSDVDPEIFWAAATLFSKHTSARVAPTGPRILRHPWKASMAVLKAVLTNLAPSPALLTAPEVVTVEKRVRCNVNDRSVYLDGAQIAAALSPRGYEFVCAVVDAYPDPIPFTKIVKGNRRGMNSTRILNSLPRAVRKIVVGTKAGYWLELPAEKCHT